ncbi:PHB depolymerase family esterase [Rhodopseudomonas sp. HC1]|uniref:extracellular catalytic domain type 1 short-chain-length polyhydroxyalkanoate depolymerase n=1 Tax=Rhodopseudomonas infernalis TaxID=2897386 RepID=UPI001EE82E60|nr:PHB depolymerase family esterase [Rhodopseudomonas infernalis]MCG6206627.1 PHB depolymerase family esterase [Rhodopseudomonas infernalis]
MSLKNTIDFLAHLRKINGFSGLSESGGASEPASRLTETTDFGANPGNLRMLSYAPEVGAKRIPLVVVLHGCTQTAAGYEVGTGWSSLAERYGFALLMPEQKRANNPNNCFNWFASEDIRRDHGEAGSIRQMVEHMTRHHGIDDARIYVTGLSAGGGMAAVMLATYPDVFAAGAVIAGLPYGVATNVRQALKEMRQSSPQSARALGDLVRHASSHRGPWPKLSVWHGTADRTVDSGNADALVRQWLDLNGLPEVPTEQGEVDGFPHQVWRNPRGEIAVESYTVTGMAHGTPLGRGDDEAYGVAGPYLLEAGISSSHLIAEFFGLTGRVVQRKTAVVKPAPKLESEADARAGTFRARPSSGRGQGRGRGLDVNAVITRALTAAGLMK